MTFVQNFKLSNATVLIALILFGTVAHYSSLTNFGLYEDDYFFFGQHIGASWTDVSDYVSTHFTAFTQGRPLQYVFSAITTYLLVDNFQNLNSLYLVGFLIVVINSYFIFQILSNWLPTNVSLIGAIIFLLHPADSTKILLTHTYIIQPALLLVLSGILTYDSNHRLRKTLSYSLAFLSLLFYESPFILFLFAPLLSNTKHLYLKSLLYHWVTCIIGILIILFVRKQLGETRVDIIADSSFFQTTITVLASLFLGVWGSIKASLYGFFNGVMFTFSENGVFNFILIVVTSATLTIWFNLSSKTSSSVTTTATITTLTNTKWSIDKYLLILITACILIPTSYLFAFTHYPPIAVTGRGTSVHFVAVVAWSVCLAALVQYVRHNISTHQSLKGRWSNFVSIVLSVLIFILSLGGLGYGRFLQHEFTLSMNHQQSFWNDFSRLTLDSDPYTVFISDGATVDNLKAVRSIGGSDWTLPIAYRLFTNGKNDFITPMESLGNVKWSVSSDSIFVLDNGVSNWGKWVYINPNNTIFISKNDNNHIIRLNSLQVEAISEEAELLFRDGIAQVNEHSSLTKTITINFKPITD